ncbi:hypothetical protein [Flavobacterium psychrotrophum]|uniref:hypothetical protein n=1 Tax=Flavobacterium psychrotrophum TaxID=2294119 RepID=UPI000E324D5E|nr:hypothetical protein [Flavobacterium psychrotrophum]
MKQILLLCVLCFSLFAKAQQDTNLTADNVAFALDTNTERIDILFPKTSQVQQDGKVIIDGRTYTVKTLKNTDFPVDPKYDRDPLTAPYKDLIRLGYVSAKYTTAAQTEPRTPENLTSTGNQWRKMQDGEFVMAWHGYLKNAPQEQTVKLSLAKVTGESILLFTLEDYIDWRTKDFENIRMGMYKVLDDAVYTSKKPETTRKR